MAQGSKQSLVRGLGAAGVAFGLTGLLAPGAMEKVYGIPPTPHARQLLRLFGSRTLALALWGLAARSEEERDRGLALIGGMSLVDAVSSLASRGETGRSNALRAATSSAFFGAAALAVRARKA